MDDYADIYYVDTRNADIRDHRPTVSVTGGTRPVYQNPTPPIRTVYATPPQTVYATPPQPTQRFYPGFAPPYPTPGTPLIWPGPFQSPVSTFFGRLTTGQVVEMVAQLFAALQPLPAAPVATRETATDINNSILYQAALAQHAKRDEQVRTLGGLVAKLVG